MLVAKGSTSNRSSQTQREARSNSSTASESRSNVRSSRSGWGQADRVELSREGSRGARPGGMQNLLEGLDSAYGDKPDSASQATQGFSPVSESDPEPSPSGQPQGAWSQNGDTRTRAYTDDEGQFRWEHRHGDNHWSSPPGGDLAAVEAQAREEGTTTLHLAESEGLVGECAPDYSNGYDGTLDVHGHMGADQQAVLQTALESIPDEARDHIGEIVLADDLGLVHRPDADYNVAGLAGNGIVYVNRSELENPTLARRVLTHELGHRADFTEGMPSEGPLFAQGTQAVTPYGSTNPMERFAETTRYALENLDLYQNGQSPAAGTGGLGDWAEDVAPDPDQAALALDTLGVDPNCYNLPDPGF